MSGWVRGWALLGVLAMPVQAQLLVDQRDLLLEDGRVPREMALDRLQQVRFAFREMPAAGQRWSTWLRGYAQDGEWRGDEPSLRLQSHGLVLGLDRPLSGQWMGGALLSAGRAEADADTGRFAVDSQHLGIYAATRVYHQLGFKLGLLHGWHQLDGRRQEGGTRLGGDTSARSLQAFGEASYAMDFRDFSLEPFAGLAWQRSNIDGFGELGGAGALHLQGSDEERAYLTLGWRLARPWTLDEGRLVGRASLALRQQLDGERLSLVALDDGGAPQALRGRDLEESSLRLDLSLDRELGRGRYLGLAYAGRLAEQAREQSLAVRLSLRF